MLPRTCHFLGLWHISKIATQHSVNYFGNSEFMRQFNKIFHGHETKT